MSPTKKSSGVPESAESDSGTCERAAFAKTMPSPISDDNDTIFLRMAASTMGGSYWIVNYNLVEIAGLLVVIAFPTSKHFGLDNLLAKRN